MEAGDLACIRISGPLLFGQLWQRLGLGEVVNDLLDGRGFEFALERAVFVSVLHRLSSPARTARARGAWSTTPSRGPMICACTTCIGPWLGW